MKEPAALEHSSVRKPPAGDRRKTAVRHLRGNAVGCLVLGFCIAFMAIRMLQAPASLATFLATLLLVFYGVSFFAAGMVFMIAQRPIQASNPPWERTVLTCAYLQIGIINCMMFWLLYCIVVRNDQQQAISAMINLAINGLAVLSLWQMAAQLKRAQREP